MIFTIATILFTSPYIASFVKFPTAPIEIVLGAIAGYFSFLKPENEIFTLMAEVGFFYLMFLAGTEVNLNLLLKLEKRVFINGSIYLFVLYFLSLIFVKIFSFPFIFTFMFSLISVGLIMALFKEFGKDRKWLNLSMNIGVLGELLSIILLTIVASALENGIGKDFIKAIILLFIFMVVIFLIFRLFKVIFWWHPEWKNFLVPKKGDKDEKDIRTSMTIFFLMIALMFILHLEIAFGAFIAGVFIATFFEHKEQLPHKLATFGFGFMIPIFFIHIGSMFELRYLLSKKLALEAILITVSMIIVRFLSSFVLHKMLTIKEQILFALSHSMPLTLLIAIATLALQYKAIIEFHYYALVLASLIEVIVSMGSIMLLAKKVHSLSGTDS
jgi:Kef-type K+ transport system membrane component KefB